MQTKNEIHETISCPLFRLKNHLAFATQMPPDQLSFKDEDVDGHLDSIGSEVVKQEPMRLSVPQTISIVNIFQLSWVRILKNDNPSKRFNPEATDVDSHVPPGFWVHPRTSSENKDDENS